MFCVTLKCKRFICKNIVLNRYSSQILNSLYLYPKVKSNKRMNPETYLQPSDGGEVRIKVIGSGAKGIPGCVALIAGYNTYLFNCGEGVQRIFSEHRIRASRVSNVFITHHSWENIGGLVGFSLLKYDSNSKIFSIHGSKSLADMFLILNNTITEKFKTPKVKEVHHYEDFMDEFIHLKFVCLNSVSKDSEENFTSDLPLPAKKKSSNSFKEAKKSINSNEVNSNKKQLNSSVINDRSQVNCFIITTKGGRGKLDLEKCLLLGLTPGPILKLLKEGEDVKLENGNVIKSSDVCEDPTPGSLVFVIDCPTEGYLDSLLQEPAFFSDYVKNANVLHKVVIHFTPSNILKDFRYQNWMKRFNKETKHVFINEDNPSGSSISVYRQNFKLNLLHPVIFPQILPCVIPPQGLSESFKEDGHILIKEVENKNQFNPALTRAVYYKCFTNNYIKGETLLELYLKPRVDYHYIKYFSSNKEEFLNELVNETNFSEGLKEFKTKLEEIEKRNPTEKKIYPKIVFLGTGSGRPGKIRNSSGILVFLNENATFLLDCGENTFNQMIVLYGKEKTYEILRNLNFIFVSHYHFDHNFGLITLLTERGKAFNEFWSKDPNTKPNTPDSIIQLKKLTVIIPRITFGLYNWYSQQGKEDLFLLCNAQPYTKYYNQTDYNIGINEPISLTAVPVWHCKQAHGVVIKSKDGWKLTYSGDTLPCDALVGPGRDSDVLIHEATFDDIFKDQAVTKAHCTTEQAIEIGEKMNAKFIFLTHFSQRYSHLPLIKDRVLEKKNLGLAFDLMEVSPYQYPVLPEVLKMIKNSFETYHDKLQEVVQKKQKFMHFKSQ